MDYQFSRRRNIPAEFQQVRPRIVKPGRVAGLVMRKQSDLVELKTIPWTAQHASVAGGLLRPGRLALRRSRRDRVHRNAVSL